MSNPADRPAQGSGTPPESIDKPASPAQNNESRVGGSPMAYIGVLAVTGAVAAAVMSKVIEDYGRPFQLPPEATAGIGVAPTPAQSARVTAAKRIRDGKNLYVTFALMGGGIGLAFGVVLGLMRGSPRAALLGFAGGAVFGAGLGAAGAFAVRFVGDLANSSTSLESEHKIIFAHLAGWAVTGLGVGLGAGFAMLERRALLRGSLAAFAGGLIGGGIYVPVAAVLMPSVDTDLIIPDAWAAKLVWMALPAVLMGVSLGRALSASHARPAAADIVRAG